MTDPTAEHGEGAYGTDKDGVLAVFFRKPVQNHAETKAKGVPIFDDVEHCKIVLPGDSRTIIVERLNDDHKKRWPEVWKAFQERQNGVANGMPIEELPILTRTAASAAPS